MRGCFLLYVFSVFQNWSRRAFQICENKHDVCICILDLPKAFLDPGLAPHIPRVGTPFISKASLLFYIRVEKVPFFFFFFFFKTMISLLTLQIKILMMKILWMVIDLPLLVLHHPKLHPAQGETLEWGPPAGLVPPLLDPSLQVRPPCGVLQSQLCQLIKPDVLPSVSVLQG